MSQNAIRHGLLTAATLVAGDDPAEFLKFARNLRNHYGPQTPIEVVLAGRIADCLWKLQRLNKVEAGAYASVKPAQPASLLPGLGPEPYSVPEDQRTLLDAVNPGAADLCCAFSVRIEEFEQLQRYEMHIEKKLSKLVEELERLQFARRRNADPYYVRHMRRFAPLGENPNQAEQSFPPIQAEDRDFPGQPTNGSLRSEPVSSRSDETVSSRTEDPDPPISQPLTPEQPGTASVNTAAEQCHANPTAQARSDGSRSRNRKNGKFAKQSQFLGKKPSGAGGRGQPPEIEKASVILGFGEPSNGQQRRK